jgi:hypothetical protein
VRLEAWPCRSPKPSIPQPPAAKPVCVDWSAQTKPGSLGPEFQQEGFSFTSLSGQTLQVVTIGPPAGEGKLRLAPPGLRVVFPVAADRIVATVASTEKGSVRLDASGPGAAASGEAFVTDIPTTIEVQGSRFSGAVFTPQGRTVLLIKLCVYPSEERKSQ